MLTLRAKEYFLASLFAIFLSLFWRGIKMTHTEDEDNEDQIDQIVVPPSENGMDVFFYNILPYTLFCHGFSICRGLLVNVVTF